jgi:hypothetical protein
MCESPLVIKNGKVQWDRCVKATMDEVEGIRLPEDNLVANRFPTHPY